MPSQSARNFAKQQGFPDAPLESYDSHFRTLSFQPRVIGSLALAAIVLQSPPAFLALTAVSWWSALLLRWNPFDAIQSRAFADRDGGFRLTPAPAPRRFAMGMAGSFTLAIGLSLVTGWMVSSIILQGLLVVALAALLLGRFCLGSYIFHLLRGRSGFANGTLPWFHPESGLRARAGSCKHSCHFQS